ncbi:putative ATBET12 [Melia azedarach]|uniref:ATBET12 n=1 Tax=Melia azedarach TaxID=155640 RepID=A0ACC1YHQ7_MELAZ|nr:putative ATBET12 [Melia azedarach]
MADASRNISASRHQPSRLQRRRPASLQISPVSSWNVAIPLLSPLASSPTSIDQTIEVKSRSESRQEPRTEGEKPVFKKWQHPAAPFCYESGPIKPSLFVPV